MFRLLVLPLLLAVLPASAQKDPALEQGKAETQQLLRDPKRVEKEGLLTPEAKAAHEQAKSLAGSDENFQEMYSVAAEVFGTLCDQTNCDAQKMSEILSDLSKNPRSFKSKVTPEQWRRIEELSKKIEKRGAGVPPKK